MNNKNEELKPVAENANANEELDLEVVELEDKVAPRDWNVYALVYR